ncbi:low-specificity L-threonine aldolase [Chloroflexota bacterium]
MKIIDLRSDTVTVPTDDMRQAMYQAKVGDDVFGEDPTINKLEKLGANILKKESALFVTSGTMSNLIAVLSQTRPGDEIILGNEAHIFWYEVGGAAALGGVVLNTITNDETGKIPLDKIEAAIRTQNIHFPTTRLLCLENTHNRCGGTVLTRDYTSAVADLAHKHGIDVHLDGARIFNAAIALSIPASELAAPADSVCFCLSKGLSAPVGSLLCGTEEFVTRARKWRKMLGGGMRQAGILAAAGIIAIEKMVERLADDHATARRLAKGLSGIPGITVFPEHPQTNIVMFQSPADIPPVKFLEEMNKHCVKFIPRGGHNFRAVTHRMIDEADIDEALRRVSDMVGN